MKDSRPPSPARTPTTVHQRGQKSTSHHDPLSFAAVLAFSEVPGLIPHHVPVILEARVTRDQIKAEIEKAQKALPLATMQVVIALGAK